MKIGVQRIYNYLKRLDSDLRRNYEYGHRSTFYETILNDVNILSDDLDSVNRIPVPEFRDYAVEHAV